MPRTLSDIAVEIYRDWRPPSPYAMPYINAMSDLEYMGDMYGADDAEEIVMRFLVNATSWRGPVAVRVKLELKDMLKKHSAQRVAREYLAQNKEAAKDTYTTQSGVAFSADTLDFSRFVSEYLGIRPGVPLGQYLRGEESISDSELQSFRRQYKVVLKSGPRALRDPFAAPKEKGPDIEALWDALLSAMSRELLSGGRDAGDMFVNMGPEYEDDQFESYLADVSGDVSQSFEYALSGRAAVLYAKLVQVLQSGEFKTSSVWGRVDWTLKKKLPLLREIYADYWHDGMIKGWEKIEKNQKEFARLTAMRASFRR